MALFGAIIGVPFAYIVRMSSSSSMVTEPCMRKTSIGVQKLSVSRNAFSPLAAVIAKANMMSSALLTASQLR